MSDILLWTPLDKRAKRDDQLEPIYNSSVPILNVALKTYWERWMIEMSGRRRSGRSVLAAQHDDDDDKLIRTLVFVQKYYSSKSVSVECQIVWHHTLCRFLRIPEKKTSSKEVTTLLVQVLSKCRPFVCVCNIYI